MLDRLRDLIGAENLLTGADMDSYARDWSGAPQGTPLAVARPGSTAEVSALVRPRMRRARR